MTETRKTNTNTNGKSPPGQESRFKGQDGSDKLRHGKKQITEDKKSAGKLKSSVISQQLHNKLAQKNEDDNIGTDATNRVTQIAEQGFSCGKDIGKKAVNFSKKLHSDKPMDSETGGSKLHFTEEPDDSNVKGRHSSSSGKSTGENLKSQNVTSRASTNLQGNNTERSNTVNSNIETVKSTGENAGRNSSAGSFSKKLNSTEYATDTDKTVAEVSSSPNSSKLHFVEDSGKDGMENLRSQSATSKGTGGSSGRAETSSQSNPASKRMQKRNIQKSYVTSKGSSAGAGSATGSASKKTAKEKGKELLQQASTFVKEHAGLFSVIGIGALILCLIMSQLSSCSSMATGGTSLVLGSSYTAEDDDILGADADYSELEEELREKVNRIEQDHPGYDEYQYNLAEINHNPYVLASYLTVLYEDYTREEVQAILQQLFDKQYKLALREEIQIRTRTETRTGHRTVHHDDGTTSRESYEYEVEVEYEYKILHVTLENKTLEGIIDTSGLDNVRQERYALLNETLGNRSYLFGDDIYAVPVAADDIDNYDIPGEALSDTRFARMVQEAEKYLGYPYVWGGSSPSTSFDCSGFVCWVINHSGNGWNYGRTTAEGLRQQLSIIPASEAKPGDIIFFQGTYNTSGASHVGIYVGNGMMIHCGNPIQYASINTNYWRQHFYCFGRLP